MRERMGKSEKSIRYITHRGWVEIVQLFMHEVEWNFYFLKIKLWAERHTKTTYFFRLRTSWINIFVFFLLKSCWHIRIRNCSYNCKQSRSFMYYTAIFSDQYSYKNGVFGKVISFIYTACPYSQFIFDAVSKIFHSHTLYQCVQWNSISSNR